MRLLTRTCGGAAPLLIALLSTSQPGCGSAATVPDSHALDDCAPDDLPLDGGGCQRPTPPLDLPCPPGQLSTGQAICQPAGLPPDMPCPPGQLAIGRGLCQPAGLPPQGCGEGFAPAGDRGCDAVLPEQPCPPGQLAIPGERTCRELAPCGNDTYGDIPVDRETEFVDQTYVPNNSDGSRERPWKTVQQGVDAAAPGAIVAVAAGVYAENVLVVGKPVRLWGRCPQRVEIAGTQQAVAAVHLDGELSAGSEVRDLAVTSVSEGIIVEAAGSVTLDRLWVHDTGTVGIRLRTDGSKPASAGLSRSLIERNRNVGVYVRGSSATIDASVVRDNLPTAAGEYGWGVGVDDETAHAGALDLTSSLVEGNHDIGVYVGGSDARIEGSVVRDTRISPAGLFGRGVNVRTGLSTGARGNLTITSSLIDRNRGYGVLSFGSDATIEASVVRDTQPDASGNNGCGIGVQSNDGDVQRGALTLRSSLVTGNRDMGVYIEASEARIEGSVIRDTQSNTEGIFGRGVNVRTSVAGGARGALTLTASLVERNHGAGVFTFGSDATIESSIVRDTQPQAEGEWRYGMGVGAEEDSEAGQHATLAMTSSLIDHNHDVGVFVLGSEATIRTSVVRDTQPSGLINNGRGIDVETQEAGRRSKITLISSRIEQNHEMGIFVLGADAVLEAMIVRGTLPNRDGEYGRGIGVQDAADIAERGALTLTSSLIEGNHNTGISIFNSTATLTSSIFQETHPQTDGEFGDGILVVSEGLLPSKVTIHDVRVAANARAGVFLVGADGELSQTLISKNRFGLVLQASAKLERDESTVIEDSLEDDEIIGGDLAVPDAASPLP